MNAYVQSYSQQQCALLADLAVNALIAEVNLTPKPALVDRRGSGAHDDLSLVLMEQSAYSLRPMFLQMAQAAFLHADCLQTLREVIGAIGRAGEVAMLENHIRCKYASWCNLGFGAFGHGDSASNT